MKAEGMNWNVIQIVIQLADKLGIDQVPDVDETVFRTCQKIIKYYMCYSDECE